MTKTLFLALFITTCSLVNSQTIPNGVVLLGSDYVTAYSELVNNLTVIEKELEAKKGNFNTLDELVSYSNNEWNRLSGSDKKSQVNLDEISSTLAKIGKGGINFALIISNLNCSENLKNILISINTSIQEVENENEFLNMLEFHSTRTNTYGLLSEESNKLKMYLTSLYANYSVLTASEIVNQPSVQGKRSFWNWLGQCVFGTLSGAGLGLLQGMGVGTVTLPIIGTISGATFGTIVGALGGVAMACF